MLREVSLKVEKEALNFIFMFHKVQKELKVMRESVDVPCKWTTIKTREYVQGKPG